MALNLWVFLISFLKYILFYLPTKIQCIMHGHDWVACGFDWSAFNKSIPQSISVRHLFKCRHCTKKGHSDHFVNEIKCSICNKLVPGPLETHCREVGDDAHLVLSIHEV